MDTVDDIKLYIWIGISLSKFQNLQKALPQDYPHNKKFEITAQKLKTYQDTRTTAIWSHFNLPLCLSSFGRQSESKANVLMECFLRVLDRFCKEFSHIEGYKGVLSPLHTSAWDLGDPCFWSVMGEVNLALFLLDNNRHNFPIIGFEEKIGEGKKTCDIKTRFNEKVVNLDVEIKNVSSTYPDNEETIRNWVTSNAVSKMDKKFISLPEDEIGLVAQIYMLREDNLEMFNKHRNAFRPVKYKGRDNQTAKIYVFIGGRLTSDGQEGPFEFYLCDYELSNWNMIRSKT